MEITPRGVWDPHALPLEQVMATSLIEGDDINNWSDCLVVRHSTALCKDHRGGVCLTHRCGEQYQDAERRIGIADATTGLLLWSHRQLAPSGREVLTTKLVPRNRQHRRGLLPRIPQSSLAADVSAESETVGSLGRI
jgi:hypothetical protein